LGLKGRKGSAQTMARRGSTILLICWKWNWGFWGKKCGPRGKNTGVGPKRGEDDVRRPLLLKRQSDRTDQRGVRYGPVRGGKNRATQRTDSATRQGSRKKKRWVTSKRGEGDHRGKTSS